MKKVNDKREPSLFQLRTPHQSTVPADYSTKYNKNYFSNMVQA